MAEHNDIVYNPDDFPSNTSEDKKKRLEKVIQGNVVKRNDGFLKRAITSIVSSDITTQDLRDELIFDYLVPTVKDTLVDMGKMLLDAIFYGSIVSRKKSGNGIKAAKVSYSDYYDSKTKQVQVSNHTSYDFGTYAFQSRTDAEAALDQLIDIIREYSQVSVADFCDVIGVTCNFTDNKYGWTDLSKTTISRTHDGYVINFDKPSPLNK